jgi:signal transduction histidine kinase
MIYLFITFIAFSILLIVKNHRSRNILWFYFMLVGFCLAFIGLALYNEYISGYTKDLLFTSVSRIIWALDYYLNLDVSQGYRIMNIGTAFYIYGAICFPLSYLSNQKVRRFGYIIMIAVPLSMIIMYDPSIIKMFYGIKDDMGFSLINKKTSEMYRILNLVFSMAIKLCLIASIGIFIYVYRIIIPIIRKKFAYMIIGIIPIHILFIVLFYWFPNHNVLYRRFFLLSSISMPYNKVLYGFITYFGIFSIVLLIYAMWRYNIFDLSVRKKRISFQRQMDTAHIGLKVFSHSIKNQIIAIKLLTEQLSATDDAGKKNELVQEITKICNTSIEKLGTSFKETGVVKLSYKNVDLDELMRKVLSKHEKINEQVKFEYECKEEINIYIDPKQFAKVIDNLIINAVEACDKQEHPVIKLLIEEKDNYFIITVSDNGSGIEHKNIKKVFDPFFSTKPMSSNWGIGLSFCQKAIEAFGGAIEIGSNEYEGTAVHIFIPTNRR